MTNTTANQSALVALFVLLGMEEEDAIKLFTDASTGLTTPTDFGLTVEASDGQGQVTASFSLKKKSDAPYEIIGWDNPWKFTMGAHTIEDGELSAGTLKTLRRNAQAELNALTFAEPAEKQQAQAILDGVFQVLTSRLPAPSASPWPFADDLLTRCGSREAEEVLNDVMVVYHAGYINTGGFTVHSPRTWEKAPEGTATLLQVFEFGEDTRNSFLVVVQDHQSHVTADFGGVEFDGSNATIDDLKLWAISATERFLASSPTVKQLGKFYAVLGQFILATEEFMAVKAE